MKQKNLLVVLQPTLLNRRGMTRLVSVFSIYSRQSNQALFQFLCKFSVIIRDIRNDIVGEIFGQSSDIPLPFGLNSCLVVLEIGFYGFR